VAIRVYESEQTGAAEIIFQNSEKNLIVISAREKSSEEQKQKRLASYICKLLEWSQKAGMSSCGTPAPAGNEFSASVPAENEQQNKGDKHAKQTKTRTELNLANVIQTAAS